MLKLKHKDLITGEELGADEVAALLTLAQKLKDQREQGFGAGVLQGKTLAMLFDKPSLRTRFSFTVAMQELGGHVVESVAETRKQEEPEDLARVLSGYCHGIMIRTFGEEQVTRMAESAHIPVINGLSNEFHPCQALADLLTMQQAFGKLKGLRLAYIGDGNNILQSFFPLAEKVGLQIAFACPSGYGPKSRLYEKFNKSGLLKSYDNPAQAVKGADVVYTDVWTSMGFEKEYAERITAFQGFQVNEELLAKSGKDTKVMHCLPMVRGQEISHTLPDAPSSLIFAQSENRLHVQKALLIGLLAEKNHGISNKNTKGVSFGKGEKSVSP